MPFLDWVNKAQAVRVAGAVPYHLLNFESAHGDAAAENLLIQGDNLLALKALLPFYRGRVKCIFIDPPYNTQSAFEHYDDKLEHSQWLSMMHPRLVLLRELLAEDGSIWVTIDDNEAHYLKVLMDEVFGRDNFVSNAVWQKKYTVANDAKWLSENHDHILIYAKRKEGWRPNRLGRTSDMNARYRNPDSHPKGPWKATPLYAKRTGSEKEQAFSFTFKNGVVWMAPRGTSPRFPAETLRRMDENGEIWFGSDGRAIPSRKTFLCDMSDDGPPTDTVWLHSDVGHNHEARDEVKANTPDSPFATPKPERLIARVLNLASSEGDLVLDSFLGSATTAAVAHKMGRRYIGIELGDHARTHCLPRLQKVIDGEQGGISEAVGWQGGGGFRFYTLGEPVFDADGGINPAVTFGALAGYLWHFETGEPATGAFASPLLGIHGDTAIFLLYNGILGDRKPQGGNVLTSAVLAYLDQLLADATPAGQPRPTRKVVYGETTRLSDWRLDEARISFRQIPYDIKAR